MVMVKSWEGLEAPSLSTAVTVVLATTIPRVTWARYERVPEALTCGVSMKAPGLSVVT
jgi:hypothetical protein